MAPNGSSENQTTDERYGTGNTGRRARGRRRSRVDRCALVPARRGRNHGCDRRLSPPSAARLAAARGRGPAALHRAASTRPGLPGGPRGEGWSAAAFPDRMGRRPPRSRPRGTAGGLRALRNRKPPGDRPSARATRNAPSCADRDRRRRRRLDFPLPRRLRADVQPLPVHERAVVSRVASRRRPRWAEGVGALGAGDPGNGRDPSVRSSRARLARRLRRGRTPRTGSAKRSGRSAPSR